MNVSYTMGLCMVSAGQATGCLTKQIEAADPGKFVGLGFTADDFRNLDRR